MSLVSQQTFDLNSLDLTLLLTFLAFKKCLWRSVLRNWRYEVNKTSWLKILYMKDKNFS